MTSVSVPSTLVKCLYLFFDLPEMASEGQLDEAKVENDAEFTARERKILLQKMFMQVRFKICWVSYIIFILECKVLLRLCSHIAAVEELARKDDLTLLFSGKLRKWLIPWLIHSRQSPFFSHKFHLSLPQYDVEKDQWRRPPDHLQAQSQSARHFISSQ